jgi:hypothetical protein
MRTKILLATAVTAVAGFATPGYSAKPSLNAGLYLMVAKVTAVKGNCNNNVNDLIIGLFDYPGPEKRGATLRLGLLNQFGIKTDEFSKTPKVGATTWNGTYVETKLPAGTKTKGTFTATLVPVDALSFLGAFDTDNQNTGCALSVQAEFLKTN